MSSISESFEFVTGQELSEMELSDLVWFIESLLTCGIIILGGAPSIEKSWFVLQMALSIATGQSFLGMQVMQAGVLYFALENSRLSLQSRLRNFSCPGSSVLQFVTNLSDSMAANFVSCLKRHLEAHPEIRVVIIDTLHRVRAGEKLLGSGYAPDYEYLKRFQELAHELGIAIVMVHHVTKSQTADVHAGLYGSAGLAAAADSTWILGTNRNSSEKILSVTGREIRERELALEFVDGHWNCLGDAAFVQLSMLKRSIVATLQAASRPLSPGDICGSIGQDKIQQVKNALPDLLDSGKVQKVGHGRYTA